MSESPALSAGSGGVVPTTGPNEVVKPALVQRDSAHHADGVPAADVWVVRWNKYGSPPTEAAQTVTQDQAEDLVHLIAARAGLAGAPHVEWVAGISGRVRSTKTGIRLFLGREILANEEDARFTIAHELGHVVRGHLDRRTVRRTFAWLAGTAGAVFLSLTAAGLTMWGVHGLALPGFAPLPVILVHRLLIRRIVQPQELEADDFAAQQQCPLTARLAERYQEGDRQEARLLSWAYPTHPSWAVRASRQ